MYIKRPDSQSFRPDRSHLTQALACPSCVRQPHHQTAFPLVLASPPPLALKHRCFLHRCWSGVKPKKSNKCIFHPWVCGFSCVLAVHRTHCRLAHRVATGNARTFSCAGVFDAVYRCFVPATRCACLLLVQPSLRTLGISKPTVEFSNSAHRCGTVCFARKRILPAK